MIDLVPRLTSKKCLTKDFLDPLFVYLGSFCAGQVKSAGMSSCGGCSQVYTRRYWETEKHKHADPQNKSIRCKDKQGYRQGENFPAAGNIENVIKETLYLRGLIPLLWSYRLALCISPIDRDEVVIPPNDRFSFSFLLILHQSCVRGTLCDSKVKIIEALNTVYGITNKHILNEKSQVMERL